MVSGFSKTVLIIASVLLIISLAIIGLLIKSATMSAKFPPEVGKCPDYLKATLNGTNLSCNNPLNLGKCGAGAFQPVAGTNVTSIIANCKKARGCGLSWDGVTNSKNHATGQPYC
jgi:ABC-type phosphate transport system permease subunit